MTFVGSWTAANWRNGIAPARANFIDDNSLMSYPPKYKVEINGKERNVVLDMFGPHDDGAEMGNDTAAFEFQQTTGIFVGVSQTHIQVCNSDKQTHRSSTDPAGDDEPKDGAQLPETQYHSIY